MGTFLVSVHPRSPMAGLPDRNDKLKHIGHHVV